MRISLEPAYVLHRRPYRETSLLLDIFTATYGRISLIARGTRTGRSPSRSILQPFVSLLVSWQGQSELMSLVSVEVNREQGAVQLSKTGLLSAFYLNELLFKVLQKQDPCPELYTIYQHTLLKLQEAKKAP